MLAAEVPDIDQLSASNRQWLAVAGLCLLACGTTKAPDEPVGNAPGTAAPNSSAAPAAAVEPPTPTLMKRIAANEIDLATLIDPTRGLWTGAYYSDPSETEGDADGMVKRVDHLCGAQIAPVVAQIHENLAHRLAQNDLEIACGGWRCSYQAAGEYEIDGRFRFDGESGTLRLVEVVGIEGGPVTAEFVTEAEAWIAAELDKLGKLERDCP
jgi:hypothetical protein